MLLLMTVVPVIIVTLAGISFLSIVASVFANIVVGAIAGQVSEKLDREDSP